jgi:hypothetical protein
LELVAGGRPNWGHNPSLRSTELSARQGGMIGRCCRDGAAVVGSIPAVSRAGEECPLSSYACGKGISGPGIIARFFGSDRIAAQSAAAPTARGSSGVKYWHRREEGEERGLAVTGWGSRERLAAPVAEIRDVQKHRSRPFRFGAVESLRPNHRQDHRPSLRPAACLGFSPGEQRRRRPRSPCRRTPPPATSIPGSTC